MSEVVKDILPLYIDGVVSDDTRNMVTKYLEHCHQNGHEKIYHPC